MCSEFGVRVKNAGSSIGTTFHGHGHSGLYVTPVYGGMAPWYPYAADPQYYDSTSYNPKNEFASMTYSSGVRGRR